MYTYTNINIHTVLKVCFFKIAKPIDAHTVIGNFVEVRAVHWELREKSPLGELLLNPQDPFQIAPIR